MSNPDLVQPKEIDILWLDPNTATYKIICGIKSKNLKMPRAARKALVQDCGTNFADPTRLAVPGILDLSFSGDGLLDRGWRANFKTLMTTSVAQTFKVAINGFGTFVAPMVVTDFGLSGDVDDETGWSKVSLTMELAGALVWTNDA